MTYLAFHLVFVLPPVLLLALATWRAARAERAGGPPLSGGWGRGARFSLLALGAHVLIAFAYTTPWDNHLVWRGVWGYPPGRVLATLGHVPVEEYAFFVLQTLLTGLLLLRLGRLLPRRVAPRGPVPPRRDALVGAVNAGGATLLLLAAAAGAAALGTERGTYLGLIAVWAFPVLAVQWAWGGDLVLSRWRAALPAVALPTLYLWIADRIAIGRGIWWISPELSTGLRPLGLPVEEALFFLVTNALVVLGMTLALHERSWERLRAVLAAARRARGGRAWRAALVLWALSMVPAPLLPDLFAAWAYAGTILLALGTLGWALEAFGRRAWLLAGAAVAFGWTVERLGSATGFPFGAYAYAAPGPALAGVPLLVPLGWWAFTIVAVAVAPVRGRLALAPLALVAWDVGLDPLMVSRGFWSFERGGWFGVPWTNFAGWYLAGLALVALLTTLEPRLARARPPELRLAFVVQAFLISVGLALFGLPLAGLAAAVAMGGLAVAWARPSGAPRGRGEPGASTPSRAPGASGDAR